ncbi:MAG: cytochrome c nitrite reductase small subunit [Pyrinomonadaceae bacterium]|jgi:cytochrome c nitrite reductase small subunit|nr:cytochrome c nitrite reductase small subunit [Blastocatellia bacterium]MCW5956261.1 cytochrome c nitrite reductase small subunit [Pyrinomonadaceae bacterium]
MNLYLAKLTILGIGIGLAAGIGVYTFWYAKGASYFSNNPQSCANCHVMNEQYDGWTKSSHKAVATCNDCHSPHDFFGKYYTKASNGFWHSYYFTTNTFHEPIQITERNRQVTEASCRYCHQQMVESITVSGQREHYEQVSCLQCHRSVGHAH